MVDLGIFPLLVSLEAGKGISASDLGKKTGAEKGLIGKLNIFLVFLYFLS